MTIAFGMLSKSPVSEFDPTLQSGPHLIAFAPEGSWICAFCDAHQVLEQMSTTTAFNRNFWAGTHELDRHQYREFSGTVRYITLGILQGGST